MIAELKMTYVTVAGRILLGLILCGNVTAENVVIHNEGFDLIAQQIIDEVRTQKKEIQDKLKTNDTMLKKFVDAVYNESMFGLEANKQNLQADPVVAHKIAIATRKILVEELVERKKQSIKVPNMEKLALAEYEAHPENYTSNESVNARHILLKFDEGNKEEKIKFLQSLSQRVAAGEDFTELAKQYSEDNGTAKKGGDLGEFTKGQMVAPFEEAVFALRQPKQLSDIVETKFGLHLIQLDTYTPGKTKEFAEVKAKIKEDLEQEFIKNEIKTWRDAIIDPKNAKLNEAELEKLIKDVKKLP